VAYVLRIAHRAQRHIDEFAEYLRDYSDRIATEQIDRLNKALSTIAESPLTWSYFIFAGAPYRAYLFRAGRRTQYWVIYTVDEDHRTVDVLHFWNVSRDPDSLDL
jgi:mRNA-degrading endonuclease RelE of RelBE toxin-antitoxin system